MLLFAADEDFNNDIVRGVLRRRPSIDIARIQDVGLSGADDATVIDWCAKENRILLTHDVSTMARHAFERMAQNRKLAGIIEAAQSIPIGTVIQDIVLIDECSQEGEWEGQIRYLPLR